MLGLSYLGVFIGILSGIAGLYSFYRERKNSSTRRRTILFSIMMIVSLIITGATYIKENPKESNSQTGLYIANGTEERRIYFHNAPNPMTARSAYINSQVEVFVIEIKNDFGYIEFVNSRGQLSCGWVKLQYLLKSHSQSHLLQN